MKILRMISRLDYFEASHNEKSQTLENQSKIWILKKNNFDREKISDREKKQKWRNDTRIQLVYVWQKTLKEK